MSEEEAADCFKHQAKLKPRRPRFRLGSGTWVDFPDQRWRCIPMPIDKPIRLNIENYGRNFKSWKVTLPSDCRARILDLTSQNSYTAIDAECSRRKTHDDELMKDYSTEAGK